jgi:hypothetical protein
MTTSEQLSGILRPFVALTIWLQVDSRRKNLTISLLGVKGG